MSSKSFLKCESQRLAAVQAVQPCVLCRHRNANRLYLQHEIRQETNKHVVYYFSTSGQ